MKKNFTLLLALFMALPLSLWAGTWEKVTTVDNPSVSGQAMIFDESSGNVIMLGDAKLVDGNIYQLNLSAYEKHWIVSASSASVKRTGHSAVYDSVRNRMIVFGGNTSSVFNTGVTDTVYTFDSINKQWEVLATTGTDTPAARTAHTAVFDPEFNRMIIFGGWNKDEDVLNNTYVLDLTVTPPQWSKVSLSNEPHPRRQAAGVYDSARKRMVIFGGLKGEGQTTDDIYALDLSKADLNGLRWEKITPVANISSGLARTGHSAVYDPDQDAMLVFGGWTPVSTSIAREFYNTTYLFDFQNRTWSLVSPGPDPPTARRNFGGAYDPVRKRFVIYGGASGSDIYAVTYNDMYALSRETSWAPSADKEEAYNYPNPFNASREKTYIKFYTDSAEDVKVTIYTLVGDLVKEWSFTSSRGINTLEWDGNSGSGKKVENGGYLCLIERSGKKDTIKIAVVR